MKKLFRVATAVSTLILASATAGAEVKLAFVDMQRAVKEVDEGKKAFKRLKRVYNKYQKEIRNKEKEVKQFQEDLKKQSLVLTEDAKKQKAAELQRKFLEFQNMYMEKQKKLQERESKLMGPIISKLVKIVQAMGASGDYTMIFEKTDSRIIWAQASMDLTNEVIRRYNASKGQKETATKKEE
jgi:outer membrane protein